MQSLEEKMAEISRQQANFLEVRPFLEAFKVLASTAIHPSTTTKEMCLILGGAGIAVGLAEHHELSDVRKTAREALGQMAKRLEEFTEHHPEVGHDAGNTNSPLTNMVKQLRSRYASSQPS